MIPENLKYTKEHEWVKIEGDEAVIGITDYAQSELGDITFVELPSVGAEVNKSDSVATIESVKAASDIYAPVSGTIKAINDGLEETPEKINQSSYEEGWIYRIKLTDSSQANELLDSVAYQKYLEESK